MSKGMGISERNVERWKIETEKNKEEKSLILILRDSDGWGIILSNEGGIWWEFETDKAVPSPYPC